MPGLQPYKRPIWTDRFKTPTVRQIRDELPANARRRFESLRQRLLELEEIHEQVAWYGDSWHWSIEFRTRLSKDPLAVLVPCPQDLQLALPMDREFASGLPIKRMKRAVRDGLELAREPFDTHWCVWSLSGSTMMDDLQDLVEMKLSHLAKRVG